MRRLLTSVVALLVVLPVASAQADRKLESTFQDDPRVLSAKPETRDDALDQMARLGADRIRVSVFWERFAPDAASTTRPAGFVATDPNAYPASAWRILDEVIAGIHRRGMAVNLNPTGPIPLWAGSGFFDAAVNTVTNPSAEEFGAFMTALARRYDGTFVPAGASAPLPRIDYWTIWNEPNQGGWLSPQWSSLGKDPVEASPARYRDLVRHAYAALVGTGHTTASDTILIGETAPKGIPNPKRLTNAMQPMRFLRRVYCLDDRLRILKGGDATVVGCAADPDPATFVAQNPGLFEMTGYAHHPYELLRRPDSAPSSPTQEVTTANLALLSDYLDRIMARYGSRRRDIPLYLTEFGYQTNPPDPFAPSPAKQASYINHAEYIAWRNKRVRTLAQFLLYDDAPIPGGGDDRWGTFQSGLRWGEGSGSREGKRKPAYAAYRTPIHLPRRTVSAKSRKLRIWGRIRTADARTAYTVEVRTGSKGRYRRLKSYRTDGYGFAWRIVRIPKGAAKARKGAVRIAWKDGSRTVRSRGVSFRVR
ncbi:MAG: glycoside hydrolase family 5 protein [Solirubrobacteraceae bacterium]|nr:glycoside hydrolase family 5 protein [Solirubrobacteraceae bacterium]